MNLRTSAIVVGFLAAVAVAGYVASQSSTEDDASGGRGGPPPGVGSSIPVVIATVVMDEFVDSIEAIGTANAREALTVRSKVTETITRVNFTDGQVVEAGDIIVELAVDEAGADLNEARAALAETEAQYERVADLMRRGISTQANLDTAVSARDRAQAHLEAVEARFADRLIRAPFSGILGFRMVSLGSLVGPGDTITTLDDITIIKVDFSVPETFMRSLEIGLDVVAKSAAYPDQDFLGAITAIDTRIDPNTRAVMVRAEIPNPGMILRPGMLMTTTVLKNRRQSLMVPEESLVPVRDQVFIYVIKQGERGSTVERRRIEIGARRPGVGNEPRRPRHLGRLGGDRDQRRLGHRGAEPQAEGEGEQRGQAALAGEGPGHGLAERKQPDLQPLDEQAQSDHHEDQADQHPLQVRKRLLQHHDLEEPDDHDDRHQIAERTGVDAQQAADCVKSGPRRELAGFRGRCHV
ncbi:MAG: efflux RND transporter periplasmic adaptor subunit [Proteobacteria bacterium]|nr:efflux RND transporter periplasmic adaptor subunit [Pseudomonadota bacterium]